MKCAVGILALATVLQPGRVEALHRQTPFLLGLTSLPGGDSCCPSVQGDEASWIVFESGSDLKGNGSTGRQVFLFNNTPPRSLTQVTHFVGDSQHPTVAIGGLTVAFDSTADILQSGSAGRQIFLWNRRFGSFTQLTRGRGDSSYPAVNGFGNAVAFQSAADLLLNGSGGTNVFLWLSKPVCDIDGCQRLVQLTRGPGESAHPVFSNDGLGTYVAFESTAALLGPSNGSKQIFVYDRSVKQLYQLTAGVGDSQKASISEDGRLVAFQSRADLLHNGSSGWEVFLVDRRTGVTQQMTNSPGDSFNPSLGSQADYLTFVSTGDLVGSGSSGQHLFIFDFASRLLSQATKSPSGDSDHPMSGGGFIHFFDSTEDPMQVGVTGRQVYALNVFQRLPSATIGERTFKVGAGDGTVGSLARLTTRDGSVTAALGAGGIGLTIGARDFDGEAPVEVPVGTVRLPPVPVPGFGALCLQASGDGAGLIDCDGGHPGVDVELTLDHNTNADDPLCLLGCREGAACKAGLSGPHQEPCPVCLLGVCVGGLNAGGACSSDSACQPHDQCINGKLGFCNGPVDTDFAGSYPAGGMVITLPIAVSLATDPGVDRAFCTADDAYAVSNVPDVLRLTTGRAAGTVMDADNATGANLDASQTGSAFVCNDLQVDRMAGARLVGQLPLLDVPDVPGLRDILLTLVLQADPGPPCLYNCTGTCGTDADCNDGDPCNGGETCVNGACVAGPPLACDDGDPCNGVETCDPATGACTAGPPCDDGNPCTGLETCDPVTGCRFGTPIACTDGDACNGVEVCNPVDGTCLPGTPPACDDGNPCTTDSCDAGAGCVHAPLSGPCDDGNACTSGDTCQGGACVGVQTACDDGNACNGVERCDPGSGLCQAGTPPTCDDANPCTDDLCDSVFGCLYVDNALPCDDGSVCTSADVCRNGSCRGIPLACDDGDVCNGVERCDPVSGCQSATVPLACDDGNACTNDLCDPVVGCLHEPITGSTPAGCLITALRRDVATASESSLRGRRLRARLVRLVDRAGVLLQGPDASGGHAARKARIRLTRFVDLVTTAHVRKDRISAALSEELIALAQRAMSALQSAPGATMGK